MTERQHPAYAGAWEIEAGPSLQQADLYAELDTPPEPISPPFMHTTEVAGRTCRVYRTLGGRYQVHAPDGTVFSARCEQVAAAACARYLAHRDAEAGQ